MSKRTPKAESVDARLERIGEIVRKERQPADAFERVIATFYTLMAGEEPHDGFSADLAALGDDDAAFASMAGAKILGFIDRKLAGKSDRPGSATVRDRRARLAYVIDNDLSPRVTTSAQIMAHESDGDPIWGEMLGPMLSGGAPETTFTAFSDNGSGPATFWRHEAGQPPWFDRGGGGTLLSVGAPPATDMAVQRAEFLWDKVVSGGMNDETRKTFAYIVAKCVAMSGEEVRVHVNDLLEFRYVKKHHSRDYRPQNKREERDRLWALSQIWVQVNDQVEERQKNGKTRKKNVRVTSQLITVAFESEMPLPIDDTPEDLPYGFRIRLGSWAKPYIDNLPRYAAPLLAKVGQYNPAEPVQRVALRLALFLSLKWRDTGGEMQMTLRELFRMATVDVPNRSPERFREQVEAALDRLENDGVIGGWTYGARVAEDEENLSRKWFKGWLSWTITLRAPAAALEALNSMIQA